jgi:catechol 2,3-dioxygenase-like lactoylglutathione lyase family enzyme
MKHCTLILATLLFCISCPAQETPKRPRILGVGRVAISLPEDAGSFYSKQLALAPGGVASCAGAGCIVDFGLNSHQRIDLFFGPRPEFANRDNLSRVTFETDDLEALHHYLGSRGIQTSNIETFDPDKSNPQFSVTDPEGHRIGFIQYTAPDPYKHSANQVSSHLIHAGFVVHDRAAEDRFYKDILGFHVYWHGGMKEGEDNWIDMQVPDGTDWVEYMLKVPENATHKQLGVMNHIALGVPDIHAAEKQLRANGWNGTEQPKIGRDGKWQLNLYDPDDTRVELMEFTPTQKPCCSEYTGPHPKP